MKKRELRNLRAIAVAQRWQLWSLILIPVVGSLMAVFGSPLDADYHSPGHWSDFVTVPLALIVMACGLGLMISNLTLLWHLYPSYGAFSTALLLSLFPYLNVLSWIFMQVHAIRVLHAAGIKVGLLGADLSSLPPPPMIKT